MPYFASIALEPQTCLDPQPKYCSFILDPKLLNPTVCHVHSLLWNMIGSPTSNRLNRFGINGQGVREELFFNNDDLNWPLDAEAIWRWESDAADSGLMHEPPSQGIDSILSFVSSVGV
jgi:hypothetical protein